MTPIEITKDNFESVVLQAEQPVLIDFWASWCGPCKMLSPIIDQIAKEADGFVVGKVDCDDQEELCAQFNVASIPTLIVFKGGKEVNRSVGVIPKNKVLELLQ